MNLDGNWLLHLPKLGWWLACEANMAYLRWRFYQPDDPAVVSCDSPGWQQTSSALLVVSLQHNAGKKCRAALCIHPYCPCLASLTQG